ncbi:MAG: hypothetical protein AAF602_27880 [Myxococcota bacterium]
MGILDRIRRAFAENETLQAAIEPVRGLEARASAAVESTARSVAASTRELAETFVEPEVLDAFEERVRATGEAFAERERAAAERMADSLSRQTGLDVSTEDVLQVGRAVAATVIAGGVAEAMVDVGAVDVGAVDVGASGAEGVTSGEGAPLAGEPTILYDGMGNMDGTTTVTDGGVAMDFE